MNELIFYGGLILAAAAFGAAVLLFFKNDIISVFRYYLKYSSRASQLKSFMESDSRLRQQPADKDSEMVYAQLTELLDSEDSGMEETEILGASNYATALLLADNTEFLPDININGQKKK